MSVRGVRLGYSSSDTFGIVLAWDVQFMRSVGKEMRLGRIELGQLLGPQKVGFTSGYAHVHLTQ